MNSNNVGVGNVLQNVENSQTMGIPRRMEGLGARNAMEGSLVVGWGSENRSQKRTSGSRRTTKTITGNRTGEWQNNSQFYGMKGVGRQQETNKEVNNKCILNQEGNW